LTRYFNDYRHAVSQLLYALHDRNKMKTNWDLNHDIVYIHK